MSGGGGGRSCCCRCRSSLLLLQEHLLRSRQLSCLRLQQLVYLLVGVLQADGEGEG